MEKLKRLVAAAQARPGGRVALKHASAWTYRGFTADEPGAIFTLAGERGDLKLIESGYVVLFDGQPSPCKVKGCGREFSDSESLKMHQRRRHGEVTS